MIPTLQTDRLLLVPPSKNHAKAYFDFYGDEAASSFYGGPMMRDAAWVKLARDIGHWHIRGHGMWIIEPKLTGAAVGGCGLTLNEGWEIPELTWWILPHARRQGFAKEASREVIRFGYEVLHWKSVRTYMQDENLAARDLTQSLGGEKVNRREFPDGIIRDIFEFPNP